MSRPIRLHVLTRRDFLKSATVATVALSAGCSRENEEVVIDPITSNEDHYITTCCGTQQVDGATWRLSIQDETTEIASLDLAALEAMNARDREHTLMCISATPNSQKISNAIWSGLPLTEIFEQLGVTIPAGAAALRIDAVEGYSTGLPLSDIDLPIWLVWRMNGEPLPAKHGFPARFLVPGRYGMKNPKWITSISFVAEPWIGYWEERGWSDTALYRANTLIRYPSDEDRLVEGPLHIVGTAYAGSDPVVSVDVSIDGGTWTPATLDYQVGAHIWTLWHFDWEATAGDHTVQARCTTASGVMSDLDPWPPSDRGGYGGSMETEIDV